MLAFLIVCRKKQRVLTKRHFDVTTQWNGTAIALLDFLWFNYIVLSVFCSFSPWSVVRVLLLISCIRTHLFAYWYWNHKLNNAGGMKLNQILHKTIVTICLFSKQRILCVCSFRIPYITRWTPTWNWIWWVCDSVCMGIWVGIYLVMHDLQAIRVSVYAY